MSLIRRLLDRLILIATVVAGGLVPGFIAQYRQRLGGRLDQAKLDLDPWKKMADQLFGGDLDKLIQYHLDSRDPIFHADGVAIRNIADAVQHLQTAVEALQTSLLQQVAYLTMHLDTNLAHATWADWVPTFALSAEGITFALLFALSIWLLFHALWLLVAKSTARLRHRRHRAVGARPA